MASSVRLLVAAIDIGTTYSGYAFSFRHEFETDPLNVSASAWTAGSRALESFKTPTTVLLDKNQTFHSFGYEAEDHYSQLAEDDDHTDWYYFRRFKLCDNDGEGGLSKNVTLKDIRDRELPALKVFSEAIKYLKGHLLKALEKRATEVEDTDIVWVLTAPAIWNDPAKQFMRHAAEQAGIKGDQLSIALESEAAIMYCKHLPVEKMGGSGQGFNCFSNGSKFLVLNAGGETVDITVHEVQPDGSLKELDKASGGSCGGNKVDESFRQMLVGIVGNDIMRKFCRECTYDFDDLFREFETKKRTVDHTTKNKVTMKIPIALKELFEDETGEDLSETLEQTNYCGKLAWTGHKLRIQPDTFRQLFAIAVDSTIEHVRNLIAQKSCERTTTIIMVGGFSESPLLQAKVKENFPKMRVIIPPHTDLAVLKGAVICGHKTKVRRAKFTYGIGSNAVFDPIVHSESRKFFNKDDQIYYCRNVFCKYVTKGDFIETKYMFKNPQNDQLYHPLHSLQRSIHLQVFVSDNTNPRFVDEPGCCQIGTICVTLPDLTDDGCGRAIRVMLEIEGQIIQVRTTDVTSGEETEHILSFQSPPCMDHEHHFGGGDVVSRSIHDKSVTRRGKCPLYRHRD